ncbi:MAG TPA: GNAT family N-acetyltransferase [Thermoanaerobaculia bacterium]|nr:GNAT family N-acetyltransferase [Thermoanaerobaculia bacterium]
MRTATLDDAPALSRLRYDFRSEHRAPAEEQEAFVARCAVWMSARIESDPRWQCWVAEKDGEIVGNLWLQRIEKLPNPVAEPEQHAYVTNVYVVPELRNAGVGARLLEAALDWCRREDVDAVLLWPSERSRSFYGRYGFGVRDDLFALRPSGS